MQVPDATPFPLDHLTLRGVPADPALEDRDGWLSFADLEAAVAASAGGLVAAGLHAGDRVASWLPKTRLACILPLACARAGLVHVPINPVLRRAQAAHILADSGAALLIADEGRAATLLTGDLSQARLRVADAWTDGAPMPPSAAAPDTLVALLYTSGSTGRAKGVMLSHANLWLGAISVAHYLGLCPDDRVLAVLPLAFDYGQSQLLSTWAAGGCAVPLDMLSPRDVVAAVEGHDVTTLAGVPPLWVQLAEAAWPLATAARLRRLTSSGGRLDPALIGRLRALFPKAKIHSMYGLTEAFRATSLAPDLIDAHPDSVGHAIRFAEVMIVDEEGRSVAAGETGELVQAGPLVAQGYWRDAERTALRFRAAPPQSRVGGRAVWSGDRARMDEDGLVRFVARGDEMIKSAGNRISPEEVEAVALAGGAAEAAAFGVPDPRLGQAVILVVRGGGAELTAHLRRELPAFMQPRRIVAVERMPIGPTGKIDRATLRAEHGA